MASSPRAQFNLLDEALAMWEPLSSSNRRHVESIADLLESRLGHRHSIYVGQGGNVVGLSFGGSTKVGMYVHPTRIDVAPDVVKTIGGHQALADLYEGFVQPPGQRSGFARFWLPR